MFEVGDFEFIHWAFQDQPTIKVDIYFVRFRGKLHREIALGGDGPPRPEHPELLRVSDQVQDQQVGRGNGGIERDRFHGHAAYSN